MNRLEDLIRDVGVVFKVISEGGPARTIIIQRVVSLLKNDIEPMEKPPMRPPVAKMPKYIKVFKKFLKRKLNTKSKRAAAVFICKNGLHCKEVETQSVACGPDHEISENKPDENKIVFAVLGKMNIDDIEKFIDNFGARHRSIYDEGVTHFLITDEVNYGQLVDCSFLEETFKDVNKFILDAKWLTDSNAMGRIMPESEYAV